MRRRVLAAFGVLVAVGGCSTSGSHAGPSTPPATGTPAPTASPTIPAKERLAAIARAAEHARYAATYALTTTTSGTAPSRVEVALASSAARVVLTGSGRTATFLQLPTGSVACEQTTGKATCFRLSGKGGRVPAGLDPQLEHVFLDYPRLLAGQTGAYDASVVPAPAPAPKAPASTCFAVTPHAASLGIAAGTYCLTDTGVVTEVAYPSGRLVLQQLAPAPAAKKLIPPAKPQPLRTS